MDDYVTKDNHSENDNYFLSVRDKSVDMQRFNWTDLILTISDCTGTILTYITETDLSNNNYTFARPKNIFAKKITETYVLAFLFYLEIPYFVFSNCSNFSFLQVKSIFFKKLYYFRLPACISCFDIFGFKWNYYFQKKL